VQPLLCLHVLSELVEGADILPPARLGLQRHISKLEDVLGGCERLIETPIPTSYSRHASRVLLIWLMLLPPLSHPLLGDAVIPCGALIAFALHGAKPCYTYCSVSPLLCRSERKVIQQNHVQNLNRKHVCLTESLNAMHQQQCMGSFVQAAETSWFAGIDEITVEIEEPFGLMPLESICAAVLRDATALVTQTEANDRLAAVQYEYQGVDSFFQSREDVKVF
jgi:predicted membrane chloride channel (bestrophin family)